MLMLGREVTTPAQLMFPNPSVKSETTEDYVMSLQENMKRAHQVAREKLKTTLKQRKRYYDLRILQRQYSEGDLVYLLDTAVVKGKCKKLSSPWKGPGIIVKKLSAYLYRVKLRNSVFVTNHDRMMPCRDRKVPAWITVYKTRSTDDEVVEDHDDKKEYCVCRKPCNGRFMIQCDYCDEWYHGSCVNISATDALDID
ncbi:uncharacterized protein [Argopecten irradians]|uniref:uncharacterized protein n=1 Tax=Argopecten irradians TaxID=31199 RepID=UPI0037245078